MIDTTARLSKRSTNSMKTTIPSLKLFRFALATLAVTITCGLSVSTAQAGYIVSLQEVGSNVVGTGSGAFNLAGLIGPQGGNVHESGVRGNPGFIGLGNPLGAEIDGYSGLTGPASFGSGVAVFSPSTDSGNTVSLNANFAGSGAARLFVPHGYVSDTDLSSSATWNNATFLTLGVTPGTYVWTWGTGPNQNFTLKIGTSTVPDHGSTFGLLFISLIALLGATSLRHFRLA